MAVSRAWMISQEETWLTVWVPFCTGCCEAQEGSGQVREQELSDNSFCAGPAALGEREICYRTGIALVYLCGFSFSALWLLCCPRCPHVMLFCSGGLGIATALGMPSVTWSWVSRSPWHSVELSLGLRCPNYKAGLPYGKCRQEQHRLCTEESWKCCLGVGRGRELNWSPNCLWHGPAPLAFE